MKLIAKEQQFEYTIIDDKVSLIMPNESKLLISIEKITGKPFDEKLLTKQALRSYIEKSKAIKNIIKGL